MDNPALPQIVKVRLKVSKSDQLRKGVDVFIGKTGGVICPVAVVLAYMAARSGQHEWPIFQVQGWQTPDKSQIYRPYT